MASCCSLADRTEEPASDRTGNNGSAVTMGNFCRLIEKWPFLLLAAGSLAFSFFTRQNHSCHVSDWKDPAWAAVFICGLPLVREAAIAIFREKRIKTSLLISTAMISCAAIGHVFAAGEVAFLMALGTSLEMITLKRAKKGLGKLVSLVPRTARKAVTCPKCLAKGEKFRDVPLSEIAVGDSVRILPGETVPVDGIITEGETTVDQSVMTGESLPVDKSIGDEVYSGTINRFGAITVKTAKTDADSSLQKLIRLVREAREKKAPVQRIADKWAARLVPLALALSVLVFTAVWAATGDFNAGLLRGVTVMVVFCPCSLALATPTAIMAAIGQAAKHGVIIKSGEALELMSRATVVCFDKTGTLTTGKMKVSSVIAEGDIDSARLLALAAAAEEASEHPLAAAIVAAADAAGVPAPSDIRDFRMEPGRGVAAVADGDTVLCGTREWLEANGVIARGSDEEDETRSEGKAVISVAVNGRYAGFISVADTVRDDAAATLRQLGSAGTETCILTGDHESAAAHIARSLSVSDVRSGLLPEGKAAAIESMEAGGRTVCMVGDGVNDAVALKAASVGIAMGGVGSDIAVEAADIALTGDDLTALAYLKRLANACVRLIHFNIAFSMAVNAVAMICSAAGLLTPVTGAIVHNCTSLFVVTNAALLYDRRFR